MRIGKSCCDCSGRGGARILLLHSFSGFARKFANRAGTTVRARISPWASIVSNSQIIRVALDYVGLLFRHCRTNSKTRKAIRHNCEIGFLHLGAFCFGRALLSLQFCSKSSLAKAREHPRAQLSLQNYNKSSKRGGREHNFRCRIAANRASGGP